jgi:hypothetical protein
MLRAGKHNGQIAGVRGSGAFLVDVEMARNSHILNKPLLYGVARVVQLLNESTLLIEGPHYHSETPVWGATAASWHCLVALPQPDTCYVGPASG